MLQPFIDKVMKQEEIKEQRKKRKEGLAFSKTIGFCSTTRQRGDGR